MKFRKAAALFLAGTMCAASFAGCASKTSTNGGSGDGSTTPSPEEEEKITATITVWSPAEDQDAKNGEWLQTTCEKFNAAHPNWTLTFEYGTCSEGDAGKTVAADPSASADVYMYANDQLQTLIDANGIAELGGATADYIKDTNSSAVVDSVTVDGGIYGVPFTTNTWEMFYNKDVFTEDDVKNLDTMLEKGKVAFNITDAWYVASFFVGNGCTMFGEDGTDNDAGIDFSGNKALGATNYIIDMVNNKNFVNDADNAGMSGMADGSVGAMFTGSWNYNSLKDSLGDKLGVVACPTITIDGKDQQLKPFAGTKAIGVNPNCENQQVAVALALYLGNAESQQSHYEARRIVPTNTELLAKDEVKADELVMAQNDTFDNKSIIQPFVPNMGNYWTPAADFTKAIISGEITKDNAAEKTEEFNKSINGSLAD